MWPVFLIAAIVLAVGEMTISGFFMGPFALGCFVATLSDLAGAPTGVSIAFLAVVTVMSFLMLRPIAMRHLSQPAALRTGTAALIGQTAMVIERIANDEGVGCIRLNGEVWTARAYDESQVIDAGEKVQVIEIRGATALVSEV